MSLPPLTQSPLVNSPVKTNEQVKTQPTPNNDIIITNPNPFLTSNFNQPIGTFLPQINTTSAVIDPISMDASFNPAPSIDDIKKGSVMTFGQSGESVKQLQEMLNQVRTQGFFGKEPIPVTSKFDAATEAALKEFQKSHRVETTGQLGPTTLTALEKALSKFSTIIRNAFSNMGANISNSAVGRTVSNAYDYSRNKVVTVGQEIRNSTVGRAVGNAYTYVDNKIDQGIDAGKRVLNKVSTYVKTEAKAMGNQIRDFLNGKKFVEFGSAAYNQVLDATQGIRNFFAGNAVSAANNRMRIQKGEVGKCMGGVNDALEKAFNLHLNCESAYMAASTLRTNPSFLEVKPMPAKMEDLPVGTIVVLGAKGKHEHGHIFVIAEGKDGKKLEACDYLSKQTPSFEKFRNYGDVSAFIPMEPPKAGVDSPPAGQSHPVAHHTRRKR